jgi:transcription antitermination protein NusB
MPIGRRTARRQAVFVLYQQDLLRLSSEAAARRRGGTPLDPYASSLVAGVMEQITDIDALLADHLQGWSLERLGVLERSILRVAVYELIWKSDVPSAVAIDEAVALTKRFCSDEAGALVNGVLGSLVAAHDATSADEQR